MPNTIKCPHCGKAVEVTEALKHQIQEKVLADINTKHKQQIAAVVKQTEEKLKKQLDEKKTLEIADLKKELEEKTEKVDEMRKQDFKSRSIFFFIALSVFLVQGAEAVDFYVSPQGNDRWSGRLEQPNENHTNGPVASLAGARDKIRRLKSQGPITKPV